MYCNECNAMSVGWEMEPNRCIRQDYQIIWDEYAECPYFQVSLMARISRFAEYLFINFKKMIPPKKKLKPSKNIICPYDNKKKESTNKKENKNK